MKECFPRYVIYLYPIHRRVASVNARVDERIRLARLLDEILNQYHSYKRARDGDTYSNAHKI